MRPRARHATDEPMGCPAAWVQYAGELGGAPARAALDGYDVRQHVIRAIIQQLGQPWRIIQESEPGGLGVLVLEPRGSPSEVAFAALDRVRLAASQVRLPGGTILEVARVSRATVRLRRSDIYAKRTVVPVRISGPGVPTVLALFDAEAP